MCSQQLWLTQNDDVLRSAGGWDWQCARNLIWEVVAGRGVWFDGRVEATDAKG